MVSFTANGMARFTRTLPFYQERGRVSIWYPITRGLTIRTFDEMSISQSDFPHLFSGDWVSQFSAQVVFAKENLRFLVVNRCDELPCSSKPN
jgi:hypothetical protein